MFGSVSNHSPRCQRTRSARWPAPTTSSPALSTTSCSLPRDASDLERQSALTASAEVGVLAARGQLRDPVATAWAFLPALAVHGHEAAVLLVRLVVGLGADGLDPATQDRAHRGVQPFQVVALERGPLAQGQQGGGVEDLVAVGVPDTGDERLV